MHVATHAAKTTRARPGVRTIKREDVGLRDPGYPNLVALKSHPFFEIRAQPRRRTRVILDE